MRWRHIDSTLAILTPEEAPCCLRFVDLLERSKDMSPIEADEWRRRIAAWLDFHRLADSRDPS